MELKLILESVLFSAQKPLSMKELREVLASAPEHAQANDTVRALKKVRESELTTALEQLANEHEQAQRSYRLVCVAGSWQFVTQPEYAPWLKALVGHKIRPPRLSQPALETLAILAYRQPVTRAEIELTPAFDALKKIMIQFKGGNRTEILLTARIDGAKYEALKIGDRVRLKVIDLPDGRVWFRFAPWV